MRSHCWLFLVCFAACAGGPSVADVTDELTSATRRFLAGLDPEQRERAQRLPVVPIVEATREEETSVTSRPRRRVRRLIEPTLLYAPRLSSAPSDPCEFGHWNSAGFWITGIGKER